MNGVIVFSLLSLVVMEIALGIDNVIFVSLIVGKLSKSERPRARRLWMLIGIGLRATILYGLTTLIHVMNAPLFTLNLVQIGFVHGVTGRDLVLLTGGIFLLVKSVMEIHEKLETPEPGEDLLQGPRAKSFAGIMFQIVLVDLVFSIDSIVTAIGLAQQLWVMISAMATAMFIMFGFAKPIGEFVLKHPTFKMLALCFLLLIGILLVAEGLGQHISKGYVYFAMAFSMGVELLNMRLRGTEKSVRINVPEIPEGEE